jgi:sortase (surface protein transpeptidase)
MSNARHFVTKHSAVARWFTTERLALWRTTAAVNLVVGVAGVAALAAYQPPPVSVGSLPQGGIARRVASPPQPVPDAIAIPSLGVKSSLEHLDVGTDGVLAVPKNYASAGWWSGGPKPGADGAAVIVGHVDSRKGPAVFFRLRSLKAGDEIVVHRVDNTEVTFVVDAIRQYEKETLPTRTVYGPTPTPALRLITCGGAFDSKTKSYRDNVVVFAHLKIDRSVAV